MNKEWESKTKDLQKHIGKKVRLSYQSADKTYTLTGVKEGLAEVSVGSICVSMSVLYVIPVED